MSSDNISEADSFLSLASTHSQPSDKKIKVVSDVWDYFQKIIDENNVLKSKKCKLCHATFAATCATSTLRRHLQKKHTITYTFNTSNKQTKLTSYRFKPYTKNEQSHITTNLVDWIAVNLQPFKVVEQVEFKKLVHSLDSRYVIPCRKTIKNDVIIRFTDCKKDIYTYLNSFTSKIALTTDIWTCSITRQSYLGITIHFITNFWEMKKCLIDIVLLQDSHSSSLIVNQILSTLEEFNINDRVISLTTDNGGNMVACGRDLAIELDKEFSNLSFNHYRCAAHIINLAVKAGLKCVDSAIIKLRQLVIKVRNSQKLIDDLRTICTLKQKQFIMPVQDVETRWNATYCMIECQIKMREIMQILVHSHNILENLFPTVSEWGKIVVSTEYFTFYIYCIV